MTNEDRMKLYYQLKSLYVPKLILVLVIYEKFTKFLFHLD